MVKTNMNKNNKKEELLKEKTNLQNEYEDILQKIYKNKQLLKQMKLEEIGLDIIGKYIEYDGDFYKEYLHVEEILDIPEYDQPDYDFKFILRGLGFSSEFTNYVDSNSFQWSTFYEIHVQPYEYESFKSKIKEITKDEFMEKYDVMLRDLKQSHLKRLVDISLK